MRPRAPRLRVRRKKDGTGWMLQMLVRRPGPMTLIIEHDINRAELEDTDNRRHWQKRLPEKLVSDTLRRILAVHAQILEAGGGEGLDGKPVDASPRRDQKGVRVPVRL